MNKTTSLVHVAALAIAALGLPAAATGALPAEVDGQPVPTLAPMIKRVSPAVVNIAVRVSVDQGR